MGFLFIGSSPTDEDCAQVGEPGYWAKSRKECVAYIRALKKKLGNPPAGAELATKRQDHDFGPYLEVVCYFDEKSTDALQYALKCEADGPATWSEVGFTHEDIYGEKELENEK